MLTVWGRRSSYNLQKVMWLIEEIRIDHHLIEVGGSFGGLDEPDFRQMNPHGKIPVIDDNGTIVWESHAILRYLAARYGNPIFWNEDPGKRARGDQWMDWAQATLQPDFLKGIFWGFYRTPEDRRDLPAIADKVALCARHMQLLNGILEGQDFMLGDDLSLADIPIGTSLYRYFNLEIERPSVPHLETYYERLKSRQSYRDHIMVPFDELYGRLSF